MYDFKLSDRDKARFEAQARKISEQDVTEVVTKFGKKLDALEEWMRKATLIPDFLSTFIKNVKLLYEMLCDQEFRISGTAKRWIVFALGYFISPIDLIPDFVPIVGYIDDALVILWVMDICSEEIKRYSSFIRGKRSQRSGNTILLQRGSSNRRIIIVPGFLSNPERASSFGRWINSIRSVDSTAHIYAFVWDTKDISLLLRSARRASQQKVGFLAALGYSVDRLLTTWNDAKLNTSIYAPALVCDIERMHIRSNRRLQVTLIGHSLGARLICNSLGVADKGQISNVFTVGGAVGYDALWFRHSRKLKSLYNCYSANDMVLSKLYRLTEGGEIPIGLRRIGKTNSNKRTEYDCSTFINGHTDYDKHCSEWFF